MYKVFMDITCAEWAEGIRIRRSRRVHGVNLLQCLPKVWCMCDVMEVCLNVSVCIHIGPPYSSKSPHKAIVRLLQRMVSEYVRRTISYTAMEM